MLKSGDVLFFTYMSIPFPKQYQSPSQLIALLKSRGLFIRDERIAEEYMCNVGYYRLSAYLYPLLANPKTNQQFKVGSTFDTATSLYNFDCNLRALLFRPIAKIEVAIRSAMANIVAKETGNIFWMTDRKMFVNPVRYQKTMDVIDSELRHSKEDFIVHFKSKYNDPYPPAWMLAEILPMGVLNHIYSNLADNQLRKKIAATFSLSVPVFNSWLTIVILTRNACCHHARIWNKENAIPPIKPKKVSRNRISSSVSCTRIFYDICIIKWFIDIIAPANDMKQHLLDLLAHYPNVDPRAMGFPIGWEHEPLWR